MSVLSQAIRHNSVNTRRLKKEENEGITQCGEVAAKDRKAAQEYAGRIMEASGAKNMEELKAIPGEKWMELEWNYFKNAYGLESEQANFEAWVLPQTVAEDPFFAHGRREEEISKGKKVHLPDQNLPFTTSRENDIMKMRLSSHIKKGEFYESIDHR